LMMDFNFYSPFHFIYLSFSFLVYFLFLELGLGLSDKDHTAISHMTQKKNVEGSGRMMSYHMSNICGPYGIYRAV